MICHEEDIFWILGCWLLTFYWEDRGGGERSLWLVERLIAPDVYRRAKSINLSEVWVKGFILNSLELPVKTKGDKFSLRKYKLSN